MTSIEDIKKAVLRKLFTRKVIGRHHMKLVTLGRCGWKAHERGQVKTAVKLLIKDDLLVWVKESQKSLTLNKGRIKDIVRYMEG